MTRRRCTHLGTRLRFVAAPDGAPAFRCECGALVRFVGLEAVEILEMLSHGTPA